MFVHDEISILCLWTRLGLGGRWRSVRPWTKKFVSGQPDPLSERCRARPHREACPRAASWRRGRGGSVPHFARHEADVGQPLCRFHDQEAAETTAAGTIDSAFLFFLLI